MKSRKLQSRGFDKNLTEFTKEMILSLEYLLPKLAC